VPATFAGVGRGSDGALEVYATVSDPALIAIVEQIHASTGRRVPVRVVPGMKNSVASLESVFARVKERYQELHDRGVTLVQFGVHVPANRVRLGVERLTPEITELLMREFGRDQVQVFEGQRFQPT